MISPPFGDKTGGLNEVKMGAAKYDSIVTPAGPAFALTEDATAYPDPVPAETRQTTSLSDFQMTGWHAELPTRIEIPGVEGGSKPKLTPDTVRLTPP